MKSAARVGSWTAVFGCAIAACGGATSSDLFAGDGASSGGTSGSTGGTSGASGASGTSGTSGASGTSGTSGASGTSGSSGTSGTSGTSGSSGNVGCRPAVASDCPAPGTYCKVVGCAVTGGVCTPKPMNQPASLLPQCGCDNITYWNETIAGGFGVNIKAPGACPAGTATSCKIGPGGTKCPDGRDCNVDVMQCAIPSGTAGVCWGLPKACTAVAGDAKYRACPPTGSANQCLSLCEVVSNERSYTRDAIVCP